MQSARMFSFGSASVRRLPGNAHAGRAALAGIVLILLEPASAWAAAARDGPVVEAAVPSPDAPSPLVADCSGSCEAPAAGNDQPDRSDDSPGAPAGEGGAAFNPFSRQPGVVHASGANTPPPEAGDIVMPAVVALLGLGAITLLLRRLAG